MAGKVGATSGQAQGAASQAVAGSMAGALGGAPSAPVTTPAQAISTKIGIDPAKADQLAAAFEINAEQWLNNPKANVLGFLKELAKQMGLQADQVEQAAIAWKQHPKG
jgi:hypothetical protein